MQRIFFFSVELRPAISHEYICFQELALLSVRRLVADIGQKPDGGSLVVADKSYLLLLRGLSPHANYTDRAAAAGRRS